MSNYSIQSNIPIPANSRSRYPLAQLLIKQCFTAPVTERPAITAAVRRFTHEYKSTKFVVRKIDSTTVGCWRIE